MKGKWWTIGIIFMLGLVPVTQFGPHGTPLRGFPEVPEAPSITLSEDEITATLSSGGDRFTENRGQAGEGGGLFYCRGSPLSVAFGIGWVSYMIVGPDEDEGVMVKIEFKSANPVRPVGAVKIRQVSNFYLSNDPGEWVEGAANYREVWYPDLYDGIDLRYYLSDGQLKYDLIVRPFSDPTDVMMGYTGIDALSIDPWTGDLVVTAGTGRFSDQAPYAFQDGVGGREEVPCDFDLRGRSTVGFLLGTYDREHRLIIDPGLEFSTYIGPGGFPWTSSFIDDDENVYLASAVYERDFPTTPGAYCSTFNTKFDGIVCKLSKDGSRLEYSTYIGGSEWDTLDDIVVDGSGSVYVTGESNSTDFPITSGSIQSENKGGSDCIVFCMNSTLGYLNWSTYLGGTSSDCGVNMDLDGNGSIYILGTSRSANYPVTQGAFDTTANGGQDLFLTKMDINGTKLIWSTYIGSPSGESGLALDVDQDGYVYFTASVTSQMFPSTAGAYKTTYQGGPADGWCGRMNQQGSALVYGTFIGGTHYDTYTDIVIDVDGNAYLIGTTRSPNAPTTVDAYDTSYNCATAGGRDDVHIVKINPQGSRLLLGSYFGGDHHDWGSAIDVDGNGTIFIAGNTISRDLPITETAYDDTHDGGDSWQGMGFDGFVARFDPNLSVLEYSSYLGGKGDDNIEGLHRGRVNTTVTGYTESTDYPTTPNAFSTTPSNTTDLVVTRLPTEPPSGTLPSAPLNVSGSPGDDQVVIGWDPPLDTGGLLIRGYNLYKGALASNLTFTRWVHPDNRSFIDRDVLNGKSYFYAVTALNWEGEGPSSTVIKVMPIGPPSEPMGFTVNASMDLVELNWTHPLYTAGSPVIGYRLHRGTSLLDIEHLVDLGNVSNYNDTNVTRSQIYYYKIRAYNNAGNGSFSPTVAAVPFGIPDAPYLPRARAVDGTIVVDWRPPSNDGGSPLTEYIVYRAESADALEPHGTVSFGTMYTDSEIEVNRTLFYAIAATNKHGQSPLSVVVNATWRTAPGPVSDPYIEPGVRRIILTWRPCQNDRGSPVNHYRVYLGDMVNDFGDGIDVGTLMVHTFTGLENGTTYYLKVTAVSALGEGDETILSATTFDKPSTVMDLIAQEGDGEVKLIWTAPTNDGGTPITSYNLYRGVGTDDLVHLETITGEDMRHTDTTVFNGAIYLYMVTAVNAVGEGPQSYHVEGAPFGLPSGPVGLNATSFDGRVELSWSPPLFDGGRPVDGYRIYKGTSHDALTLLGEIGNITSYIDAVVIKGNPYHYTVAALNERGEGPQSIVVTVHPEVPIVPPGPPESLVGGVEGKSAVLEWAPPTMDGGSAVSGYVVYRGTSADSMLEVVQLGLVLSFEDEDIEQGKTHYYGVTAKNVAGEGKLSNVVVLKVERAEESMTSPVSIPLIVLISLGAIMLGIAGLASTEPGRYRLALLALPLLSRSSKEAVLDNKTRYALHGIIVERPGIHYTALMEEFGLANGAAAYHLDVLERENFIKSVRDGRLKRFYSTNTKVPVNQRKTPEEIRSTVTGLVNERPGISQKEIIEELGIDRDIVGYHLRELVKEGRLKDSREGKYTIYHSTELIR